MGKVLEFYDLKTRKKFRTGKYTVTKVKGRRAARAKSPSGIMVYRFLPKK